MARVLINVLKLSIVPLEYTKKTFTNQIIT